MNKWLSGLDLAFCSYEITKKRSYWSSHILIHQIIRLKNILSIQLSPCSEMSLKIFSSMRKLLLKDMTFTHTKQSIVQRGGWNLKTTFKVRIRWQFRGRRLVRLKCYSLIFQFFRVRLNMFCYKSLSNNVPCFLIGYYSVRVISNMWNMPNLFFTQMLCITPIKR